MTSFAQLRPQRLVVGEDRLPLGAGHFGGEVQMGEEIEEARVEGVPVPPRQAVDPLGNGGAVEDRLGEQADELFFGLGIERKSRPLGMSHA